MVKLRQKDTTPDSVGVDFLAYGLSVKIFLFQILANESIFQSRMQDINRTPPNQ